MTENGQVEEMAEIISTACKGIKCSECETRGTKTSACVDVKSAEALHAKGYHKVERGEWIAHPRTNRSLTRGRVTSYNVYRCSICERSNGKRKSPFCPNCGADMRGRRNERSIKRG